MNIAFDPAKDALNLAKHGVSLARASEMEVLVRMADGRFSEPRCRAFGLLDGVLYCLAYVIRDGAVRAISLRRAHLKELRRHAQ